VLFHFAREAAGAAGTRLSLRPLFSGRKVQHSSGVSRREPCDPRDPSVIPHDSQPYLKLAPSTQFVSVELTYRDGSVSEIKSFQR
jgi:hypothetical protein